MSKSTAVPAWVPIDKRIVHTFKEIKGPFPKCAALISYSLDVNCGVVRSASAYSRMWSWSRSRVNRFIKSLEQSEQLADSLRTGSGHPISVVDLSSRGRANTKRTLGEQVADTKYKEQRTKNKETTKKKSIKEKFPHGEFANVFLTEKQMSDLHGKFNSQTGDKIEALSIYLESTGKKYKSHYATILAWDRMEKKKGAKNGVSRKNSAGNGYVEAGQKDWRS